MTKSEELISEIKEELIEMKKNLEEFCEIILTTTKE